MDTVISKDGTRIAWMKAGSGPPLVLVDGALCYTEAGATPGLLPVLQPHFTVYAWDRRGRGQSGNTPPWSLQKEIDDLAAVCALCPEPPLVCGFSSGAALTMYAGAAGLNARRLVLFEAPFVVVDETDPKPPADALQQLQGFIRAGDNKGAVTYFMRSIFRMPAILVWIFNLVMRRQMQKAWAIAPSLLHDIGLLGHTQFTPPAAVANSICLSTVVLYGGKTQPRLAKASRALAALIPGARLGVLPNSSHSVKPAELLAALQAELALPG